MEHRPVRGTAYFHANISNKLRPTILPFVSCSAELEETDIRMREYIKGTQRLTSMNISSLCCY